MITFEGSACDTTTVANNNFSPPLFDNFRSRIFSTQLWKKMRLLWVTSYQPLFYRSGCWSRGHHRDGEPPNRSTVYDWIKEKLRGKYIHRWRSGSFQQNSPENLSNKTWLRYNHTNSYEFSLKQHLFKSDRFIKRSFLKIKTYSGPPAAKKSM